MQSQLGWVLSKIAATTVIPGKFWILEENGAKVGTLQSISDSTGIVFVRGTVRERYQSLALFATKYNVVFKTGSQSGDAEYSVHGMPCDCEPFKPVYDQKRKLPLYTKTAKSLSYYCAGYYKINYCGNWVTEYCPKLITVAKNQYTGPHLTGD